MATIANKRLMRKPTNKMILKKTAILFLGCILIFSCNKLTTIPVIDLNRIDRSINLNITDILKDISLVQISPEFLLATHNEIYVTAQYLVINTRLEIHLFSRDGTYIRTLARKGRGPGEFITVGDFFVDEDERFLYYINKGMDFQMNRIDLSSGKVLDPIPIDFNFLKPFYINGILYGLPGARPAGPSMDTGTFPDSGIVACSIVLPSGEMEIFQGYHSYPYFSSFSAIKSYYDEVFLLNYNYSDTLFTLKDNRLSPLYVLRLSNKPQKWEGGGNSCNIFFAYRKGIVFEKVTYKAVSDNRAATFRRDFLALYDRERNVFKIENLNVIDTQVDLTNLAKYSFQSSYFPVACGKYGYMLVGHDFFETLPADLDPDNDNPIIIVGTLK